MCDKVAGSSPKGSRKGAMVKGWCFLPLKTRKALENQGLLCWGAKLLPRYGCSCQARTDDNFGQKHCHLASSINLLARFCVSSDNRPPFFRHWRRSGSVQLTASAVNLVQTTIGTKRTKKKARTPFGVRTFLAAPVRLELTTTRLTAECSTD